MSDRTTPPSICLAMLISKAKELAKYGWLPPDTLLSAGHAREKGAGCRDNECCAMFAALWVELVEWFGGSLADELGDDTLGEVQDERAGHNVEQRVHLASLPPDHLQHHVDDEPGTDADRDREREGHQGHGEEGW